MTTKDICEWLPALEDSPYFKHSDGRKMHRSERLVLALKDPSLGWNVAMAHAKEGADSTPLLIGPEIDVNTAYHYLSAKLAGEGVPLGCETMEIVDGLLHPANARRRAVLNALLLAPNASFESVSAWLGIEVEVVTAYSNLVFNVRDRLDDRSYIADIVFPVGRMSQSGKAESVSDEQKLLQIGWEKGGQEALRQAGYIAEVEIEQASTENQLEHLEAELIATALQDVKAGNLDSPALKQVRPLLVARAERDSVTTGVWDDLKMGLGAVGIGRGIIATVKRIQGPDIEKRLNLPSAVEIDAAKRKFSELTDQDQLAKDAVG